MLPTGKNKRDEEHTMPRDTREPQEILDHVTRARVTLTAAIYGLSEEELAMPGAVGKWSVKEVMAHIGRWESVCYDVLRGYIQDGRKPTENYADALPFNERWEAELRALSLQESVELFETAHYHVFGLLSGLRTEQWDGYVRAWVMGSTWHHFEEHAGQIRAWRDHL
jgi:hypothetical protein